MKSNVVMTRKMGEFDVLQRTSDGYFDANILLHQWNNHNRNADKKIAKFLDSQKTIEFIEELEYQNSHSAKNYNGNNQAVIKVSGRFTKNGKTRDQVWMHPYLFIDFAMWLNPTFKVQVLKFVYDELIKNRHLAGDNYNRLTAAIAALPDVNYPQVAKCLNWIVFNKHERNIRNNATHEQLDQLHRLEEKLAFAVDMGLINNNSQLISTMRKMYAEKYQKF